MADKAQQQQKPTRGVVILRWLAAAVLLGGLIGSGIVAAMWLTAPDNVPLERVRIDGDLRHTGRELLRSAMAPELGGSFFSLDLEAVRAAVEALPWITRASVRRVWPGTLVVHIEEREALARWGEAEVVSPQGEVFRPEAESVPEGLASLSGPDGSAPEVVNRYGRMRQRLVRQGLEIAELRLSKLHAWSVQLEGGLWLHLGNRDIEQRLERFLKHFPVLPRQEELVQVDLRYSNGFAVRRMAAAPEEQEHEHKAGAEG